MTVTPSHHELVFVGGARLFFEVTADGRLLSDYDLAAERVAFTLAPGKTPAPVLFLLTLEELLSKERYPRAAARRLLAERDQMGFKSATSHPLRVAELLHGTLADRVTASHKFPRVLQEAILHSGAELSSPTHFLRGRMAAVTRIPEIAEAFSRDAVPEIRASVAANPCLPGPALARLIRDPEPKVRYAAGKHPEARLWGAAETAAKSFAAAGNPNVGPAVSMARYTHDEPTIRELAASPNLVLRASVALNRRLPPDVAEMLMKDEAWRVRESLARNASTPAVLVERLVADPEWSVRYALAGRPDLSSELIERLARDEQEGVRGRIRRTGKITAELAERLAHDERPELRALAAKSGLVSYESWLDLIQDPELSVRVICAECAGSSAMTNMLVKVQLMDSAPEVLEALASNQRLLETVRQEARRRLKTVTEQGLEA